MIERSAADPVDRGVAERVASSSRREAGPAATRSTVDLHRRPRDFYLRRMLAAADVAALGASLGAVVALSVGSFLPAHLLWGFATAPLWLLILRAYGLYEEDGRRVSHSSVDDIPRLLHGVLLGCLGLFAYFGLTPAGDVEVGGMLALAVTLLIFGLGLRTAARLVARRVLGPERVLLVGGGAMTALLVEKMLSRPRYALQPIGVLRTGAARSPSRLGVPTLGKMEPAVLAATAARWRIDRVVVSAEELPDPSVAEVLRRCRQLGLKVSIVPAHVGVIGPSAVFDHVEGVALIGVTPPVLRRSSLMAKRAIDVAGAVTALLVLSPILLAAAIAVKLSSPGPIFFRQVRVGAGGRRFLLTKFRTMVADAEAGRADLLRLSKDSGWLHVDNDPRITRVGRFLRRSSLDELPQLVNVLKGEMSLVGPRPLIEDEDRNVDDWGRGRLDLTPGITGLWQVLGRTSIPFEEMIKLDYMYVTNWSLWGDIKLILRTLPATLSGRGVN